MTVQCCKCKKVNVQGEWTRPAQRPQSDTSHTYCPACYDEALEELTLIKNASQSPSPSSTYA